jgi:hypothetical protein
VNVELRAFAPDVSVTNSLLKDENYDGLKNEEGQKEEGSLTRMCPQRSQPSKGQNFRLLEVELRAILWPM